MPFAGTYILGGSNYKKNKNLPIPELQDAVTYFQDELKKDGVSSNPVLLNFAEIFCLTKQAQSAPYEPISASSRRAYIRDTAQHFNYAFKTDEIPTEDDLFELFANSIERLKRKQLEVSLYEDLNLVFDVSASSYFVLN